MKNKNKILIFILVLLGSFAVFSLPLYAATFTPLETYPTISGQSYSGGSDISTYLQWVFAFGISAAGILAVLMIVIGGIQYITSYGNTGQIENAKNRIYQALLGLLLAICAWLILNTINPDLAKGKLNIPPIQQQSIYERR